MQPGGKIESGERSEVALARELKEELNASFNPDEMVPLGLYGSRSKQAWAQADC